ncbi:GGDEF domain-containing protein [Azorhizobium sp. AG788]|uniref:GGDEF domain-containing protein n=1 Tax=Azorhizobium sp. AG788 TaxID=2183897 RepID=UPI0031399701
MEQLVLEWSLPIGFGLFGLFFLYLQRIGIEAGHWGAAFILLGIGYGITICRIENLSVIKPVVEDSFLLLGTYVMASGVARHFHAPGHRRLRAAIVGAGVVAAAVSVGIFASVRVETTLVQAACGLQLVVALGASYGRWRHAGDRLLYGAFLTVAAALLIQSGIFFVFSIEGGAPNEWQESIWGFIFKVTGAALGVLLSFAILLAVCMNIIERLRSVSHLDPLTGVLNRRGFDEACARLVAQMPTHGMATVTIVDIDHFKTVNDNFGHQFGDEVLQAIARALLAQCGVTSCVGRLGGDEFAFFSATRNVAAATSMAEAVRGAFQETVAHMVAGLDGADAGQRVKIAPLPTASLGIATIVPGQAIASAIAQADRLLYDAKREGRDRVVATPARAAGHDLPSRREPRSERHN